MEYFDKIKSLDLEKVIPSRYEDKGDHVIITIYGGFNGKNDWPLYLLQITRIVQTLDAWVIDLINDCPDDVWTLRIGVDKYYVDENDDTHIIGTGKFNFYTTQTGF